MPEEREKDMKEGIHPKYGVSRMACACGNSFITRATKPEIRVEICSVCHPFYTGQQKIVDTEGRVERFVQRYARYQEKTKEKAERTAAK
jgi:large subunit ribosomal protein L31